MDGFEVTQFEDGGAARLIVSITLWAQLRQMFLRMNCSILFHYKTILALGEGEHCSGGLCCKAFGAPKRADTRRNQPGHEGTTAPLKRSI